MPDDVRGKVLQVSESRADRRDKRSVLTDGFKISNSGSGSDRAAPRSPGSVHPIPVFGPATRPSGSSKKVRVCRYSRLAGETPPGRVQRRRQALARCDPVTVQGELLVRHGGIRGRPERCSSAILDGRCGAVEGALVRFEPEKPATASPHELAGAVSAA